MQVDCITLDGSIKKIPQAEVKFRPAAFSLLRNEDRLLLLKLKATGKYHLPGGGVELGEPLEQALKREVLEETGLQINVGELAFFEELFFYYDPSQTAYHGLHFYMHATPQSTNLLIDSEVSDGSAEKPRWIPIDTLHATDFQNSSAKLLECIKEFNADREERG